jgi:site-specific DNA recombinase
MTTSAVYLRISKDKALGTDDEGLAVDRQRKDIHNLLKAKGWEIGPEYLENDTSASGKVPRPEYARMLADYEAGKFGAMAAWDLDRFWRVPMEFEHLLGLVDTQGLMLATVGGDADLATDNGILYARIKVAVAASELSRRSARQKARFAQDREAGNHHWRGRRPFGLTLEGKLVEKEAQAIRDIAEIILNDGTISSCVTLLSKRGILTTFGQEWQRQPLRRTLMHPRLAGLREHKGELIKGNWEAVLDEDQWRSLVDRLSTPGRPKLKQTKEEYLLSGLLTCKECGGKAYGIRTLRRLKDVDGVKRYREGHVYRCALTHVSKSLRRTDDLVIFETVKAILTLNPEAVEVDKRALKALRQARAKELKWWADWQAEADKEGFMPSAYRKPRELHTDRLRKIESRIAEMEKVSLVRLPRLNEEGMDYDGKIELVFDWDRLSLQERRRMVSMMWESITIHGTRKGARWDDRTVVMVPRKL